MYKKEFVRQVGHLPELCVLFVPCMRQSSVSVKSTLHRLKYE